MLKKNLYHDQIQALKNRDTTKLDLLRYILAQIKNKEIEKQAELTDKEVTEVLKKIVKELEESIDASVKGERGDLEKKYREELDIAKKYL